MAHEGYGTCRVEIAGKKYDRMLSMNLQNSVQDHTPKGTIVLSWSGVEHYAEHRLVAPDFIAGAQGKIWLDGQLAATIRFDTRISKGSPNNYELTLNFRGNQSVNLDSSVIHDTGQWNNELPLQIIKSVMRPGTNIIELSAMGEPVEKMIVATGELVDRFADRVARTQGLSFFETPEGDWMLKKVRDPNRGFSVLPAEFRVAQRLTGQAGTSAELPVGGLVIGRDFTQWSVKHDVRAAFGETQAEGAGNSTDEKYGEQNENPWVNLAKTIVAAKPEGRAILQIAPAPQDQQSTEDFADFQSASSDQQRVEVTLKMSTWSDSSGNLWKLEDKWHVSIPIDSINDTLMIKAIEFELTKDSRSATLVLVGDANGSFDAESIFATEVTQRKAEMEEEAKQPEPIPPTSTTPEPVG